MSPSFEEKSVYVQLAAVLLGTGAYLLLAVNLLQSGVRAMPPFAALLIVATLFMVVLQVIGHALAAVTGRPEGRDERDRLIAWRAEHNSSWVLGVGVSVAVACLVLDVGSVWTANALVLSFALSEVLGLVLRILYYRRGV